MALIQPIPKGITRTWELVSTALDTTGDISNVAEGGLAHFLGTIYIITSNTPSMTISIQESPDNSNWVTIDTQVIAGNEAYRIQQPFPYLRLVADSVSGGQIDNITLFGIIV